MTPEEPKNASRLTDATRQILRGQLASGADSVNPDFLYSTTATALLLAIESGLIDPVRLARAELASRGLDADGGWCGFPKSREIHLGVVDDRAPNATAEQAVAEIARRILHLDTLDARNCDSLDFPEGLSVWQLREALSAAFAAGQAAAK